MRSRHLVRTAPRSSPSKRPLTVSHPSAESRFTKSYPRSRCSRRRFLSRSRRRTRAGSLLERQRGRVRRNFFSILLTVSDLRSCAVGGCDCVSIVPSMAFLRPFLVAFLFVGCGG